MRTDIKTLYIDFDGTLVNTIKSIVDLYNEDFKYYKNFNYIRWWDIDTWGFEECNCAPPGYIDLYFNQPRFFEKLKFMQWAQWAVKKLSQYYTIKIVSHGYSPNLKQKESYSKEWFPFAEFIGVNLKEYSDKAHIDMESRKMIVWKHLVMVDLAVRIRKRNDINAKFGRNVNACRCNESFKIR